MIPLAKFKILLGKYAENLTDSEVEQIRLDMYQLADTAFDIWVKEKQLKLKVAKDER